MSVRFPRRFSHFRYGIIDSMDPNIIGVRFTKVGKIYHFDSSATPNLGIGEHVIVDTSRGKHLGEVVQLVKELPPQPEGGWRPVARRATRSEEHTSELQSRLHLVCRLL